MAVPGQLRPVHHLILHRDSCAGNDPGPYIPGQLRYQRRSSEFDWSSPRFWGVQAWFPLPESRAQSGGNGYIGYGSFYSFMGIRGGGRQNNN
ncbi:hypothetical protein D3C74_366250 [compost metagenome]